MAGMERLPADEQRRIKWVINWTSRMAEKYGGIVYEKATKEMVGRSWDWGQALCRECYGLNWNDIVLDSPTWDDIGVATRWEQGEIPSWVDQYRTKPKRRKDG